MRLINDQLRWAGGFAAFGNPPVAGMCSAAAAFGLPAGNGWQSDPIDCRGMTSLGLELAVPAGPCPAMLFVGSTTTGLGLLFVANTPGVSGNGVSITITAPSGAWLPATAVGSAITLYPGAGMSNAAMAYRLNSDPTAGALVQAYPWGITFSGDTTVVPQIRPINAAELDPVAVAGFSQTSLAGGAASSNPMGNVNLYGSGEPTSLGFSTAAPLSTLAIAGASGSPYALPSVSQPPRWVVAQFIPSAGSIGNLIGAWGARANA